jgi:hypothetical protein
MTMKGYMKISTLLKLLLYVFIATASAIVGEFAGATLADIKELDPLQWIIKTITVLILPPLITARAFIDQSITTFTDER